MIKKNYFKVFSLIMVAGLLLTAIAPMRSMAQSTERQASVQVDPQVYREIQQQGSTSYWVDFYETPDLRPAYAMNWQDRGWYVYQQLTETANASQANVLAHLDGTGVSYQSFWIKNTVLVSHSDLRVLNGLLGFPEIAGIRPLQEYILYEPEIDAAPVDNVINSVEPNIAHIKADQVWALGHTGSGLVVSNIDTGVRYTHQALVNQYRGNLGGGMYSHDYNWFDPYGTYVFPADGNGHGTHVMGTSVGDDGGANQIGVAPGAEWMACRGCSTISCADYALLGCAQFVAAPTTVAGDNPNPDLRAHIVNNSWGDCGQSYDNWFQTVVDAWHAAGVYPVFSNGNASNCGYSSPPGLNTVGNPARYGNVTGVGSSGRNNDQYASHSNWGPTDNPDTVNPKPGFEMMKPQVLAPGVNIRSSVPNSDSAYEGGWSGTSMASPHVTGLVALMWQAAPCLVGNYAVTETLLEDTATPIIYDDGSPLTPTNYPNFAAGWGEIDALAAVQAAENMCGESTLNGTVTDSITAAPLQNAEVQMEGMDAANNRTVYTDSDGFYSAFVNADTYSITVSKFGYESQTEAGIVLSEESAVTTDFALVKLPAASVSGLVWDGGIDGGDDHGYPLYASLTFSAPGFSQTLYADPFTGAYEIELYLGEAYDVTVEGVPDGYDPYIGTLTPLADPHSQDFVLYVNETTCAAPGYSPDYDFFWHFEDDDGGFVPSGTTSWAWGEFTSGPGEGHSGIKGIATNPAGDYSSNEMGYMTSPQIDLSGFGSGTPVIQWWDWKAIESVQWDWARFDVTKDGGVTWDIAWGPVGGVFDTEYQQQTVTLDPSYLVADFQFRFTFQSDFMIEYAGWYVDDVSVMVVESGMGDSVCEKIPGGVVSGFVYDSITADKLVGAQVTGPDATATTFELPGDPDNAGLYWLFQPTMTDPEQVMFTASKALYGDDVQMVDIYQSEVNRQDFNLATGHLLVDPNAFEVTMVMGDAAVERTMNIRNDGSGSADFSISEIDQGQTPVIAEFGTQRRSTPENAEIILSEAGPFRSRVTGQPETSFPQADVVLILDDGTNENNIGIGGDSEFIYLNRFTPDSNDYPFTLNEIQVYFEGGTTFVSAGDEIILVVYENTTGNTDPAIGSNFLASFPVSVEAVDSWNTFTLPGGVFLGGPGDVLIGVVAIETPGSDYYPAALDQTFSHQRSWAGWWTGSPPPADLALPPDDDWTMIDAHFPGNWLIRGLGSMGGGDVVWLSVDPVSGTLMGDEDINVTLTFDPSVLEQPGDYQAELMIKTNSPHPVDNIPVMLTLLPPANFGTLKGTVMGLEACDINPSPLVNATVNVYDDGVLVASPGLDLNGYYSWSLVAGTYDIEVVMDGYITQTAEGIVLGEGATITSDFDLRLIAPCLSMEPSTLEHSLRPDTTSEQTLMLVNSGAGEAEFELWEMMVTSVLTDQLLLDPSFEAYTPNPYWEEYSLQFGTPLCTVSSCGLGTGTGPRTGDVWAWFGGISVGDTGYVSQDVVIDPGVATLAFHVEQVVCGTAGASNFLRLQIDGTEIWRTDGTDPACGEMGYRQITLDVSNFADGLSHEIKFEGITVGSGNFFLDDVELHLQPYHDLPWMSLDTEGGTIEPDSAHNITVSFDAAELDYGDHTARIRLTSPHHMVIDVPVTLSVYPNTLPVAENKVIETFLDAPVEITLIATDVDGDELSYEIVDEPENGTLVYEDGDLPVLTYDPDEGWFGEDSFTFTANDGWGDSNIATVTINVSETTGVHLYYLPLFMH